MKYLIACLTAISLLFVKASFADDALLLKYSIYIDRDSVYFGRVATAGDFNNDGYPDMAIGVEQINRGYGSAVYLFYGGPNFDTTPDLVFMGEPQNDQSGCSDFYLRTAFGSDAITALSDFNGDGFNDLAISASYYCPDGWMEGRIYIYFGGLNPDTTADLIIDGYHEYDFLGSYMDGGDFNGDGLSDLLALSENQLEGTPCYIYLGGNPPDNQFDWEYHNFDEGYSLIYWPQYGIDINNDGFDDFCVNQRVFLGGNPINPDYWQNSDYDIGFARDITGDSIDDVILIGDSFRVYLSTGGETVDLDPDYYLGYQVGKPFRLTNGNEYKFIMDNTYSRQLLMYDVGIPFDSIPIGSFSYYLQHYSYQPNLGDIDADGYDEFSYQYSLGDTAAYINICSIMPTAIEEDNDIRTILTPYSINIISYPNPFNSATTLTLTSAEQAEIGIYDITGRLITTLHSVGGQALWDASGYSSGLYFARAAGEKGSTIKLVLVK
jgi:hypothetical protein